MSEQHTNQLIHESSPYLLQHAHNPVDWYPWGETALQKAKDEGKPILLSIGYSACHWCHVMEHESFEDHEIAEIMNRYFVCIKLDREERPDIDQLYMDAVQAMGLQGGWPLNVFLLPNQQPFYGGTYFPKKVWKELLENINKAYHEKRDQLIGSAERFTESLRESAGKTYSLHEKGEALQAESLLRAYQKLADEFDTELGGMRGAPKFPMPSIWQFVMRYHYLSTDASALEQLTTTLEEMAFGGIYDQLGGGFARYSVDDEWFAPHFEKMLYDNAQLITLYAEAYQLTKNHWFEKVVRESIAFIANELSDANGGFYAALDADTEGEEGKFYTWTKAEVDTLFGHDAPIICEYFNITEEGNWENGRNILILDKDPDMVAELTNRSLAETEQLIGELKERLLEERNKRNRPGLDNKILCGWNGMMVQALAKAYQIFGDENYLEMANQCVDFISSKMYNNGQLMRTFQKGEAKIKAYLEDYAGLIGGLIELYQAGFDKEHLDLAKTLTDEVYEKFFDHEEKLFFFSPNDGEALIARRKEIFDNVIPSSNSMMAENLYRLGCLLAEQKYTDLSMDMVERVMHLVEMNARYMTNWAATAVLMIKPSSEVAIIGTNFRKSALQLYQHYLPCKVVAAAPSADDALNLLANRTAVNGKDTYYICYGHSCQRPVNELEEAVAMIENP